MLIKTKYDIGQTLSVISDNAIKDFEVNVILAMNDGISYGESLYSSTYAESKCFASRQELCDYILGNTENNNQQNEEK